MRPPVRVLTSENEIIEMRGHYEVTELFVPNSWNCPDFPIAHSLNDNELHKETAICGAKWIPIPELIEESGMQPALCLECIRLYEEEHFGFEITRRPELGAI